MGRSTANGSCSQPLSWLHVKVQAKPVSSVHLDFAFWIPNGISVVNFKSHVVNWLPLWSTSSVSQFDNISLW